MDKTRLYLYLSLTIWVSTACIDGFIVWNPLSPRAPNYRLPETVIDSVYETLTNREIRQGDTVTIAAIKAEANSWRWALFAVAYTTTVAWIVSFLVYRGGLLLGFS